MDDFVAPLHPEVVVTLIGRDGNAFAVLGSVQREMKRAGISRDELERFLRDATRGSYSDLLETLTRWVTVE